MREQAEAAVAAERARAAEARRVDDARWEAEAAERGLRDARKRERRPRYTEMVGVFLEAMRRSGRFGHLTAFKRRYAWDIQLWRIGELSPPLSGGGEYLARIYGPPPWTATTSEWTASFTATRTSTSSANRCAPVSAPPTGTGLRPAISRSPRLCFNGQTMTADGRRSTKCSAGSPKRWPATESLHNWPVSTDIRLVRRAPAAAAAEQALTRSAPPR